MSAVSSKTIPSPKSTFASIQGMRKKGFLGYVGELWQEYGDLFEIKFGSRRMVFAMNPEHVRYINITNRKNYEKAASYNSTRKYLLGNGLLTSTGDFWKRQRKLMSPFYTPRGVEAYAEIMLRDTQRLVERWEAKTAKGAFEVEIGEEMTFVTALIILKAMFSMDSDEEIISMKDAVETMIGYVSSSQRQLIKMPHWFPTTLNRRYKSARTKVHDYINALIQQRRSIPESAWPNDLLTKLMQARDEETGEVMSQALLRDESITTFFAGHETTAKTMTFAWYALSSNPEVAAKLHKELDRVLGGKTPSLADLHQLPYTLQVIKETLRLYPPAPVYVRDALENDTIDGYEIAAGTPILMSPYYTHRHKDFWEVPERFMPERWTTEAEAARHPYAYHPFAAGQRVCIGNNFSLLESHILLAMLAQKFAPTLQEGFQPQWVMAGVLGSQNGMPMRVERR